MIINGTSLYLKSPIKNMEPSKITGQVTTHGLGEAGYDIRIKQEIRFSDGHVWINGGRHDGNFVIASAMEEFEMPSNLVGIVHDKSTWARRGLSVFNTVIEPGFKGGLTLELVYHGVSNLLIPTGSGIAQVVFHRTIEEAFYNGKYQGQSTEPTPAR